MSRWFRHYAGMMRDDKLVRVAIRSKQTIERVVWIYGAILESASEIDDGGRYDFDAAEAAYFLRADQGDVDSILRGLEDCGRIHQGSVAKWGDRQFQSDRSAERQKRYRERQKEQKQDPNSNGGVTSPSRHRDAPETDTETETDKEITVEPNPARATDCFNEICNAAGWHPKTDTKRQEGLSIIDGWLALGCSLDLILESVRYGSRGGEPTSSLRRFDGMIRKKRREQLGGNLPITSNDVGALTQKLGRQMRAA